MEKRQIGQLTALLEKALDDDNFLPLPRQSKPGEPTSWVSAKYKDSWLKREKLLVVPTLTTAGGFLVGITEIIPGKAKFGEKKGIECRFILDTPNSQDGPVVLIGTDSHGEMVLARREGDNQLKTELPSFLNDVLKGFNGVPTKISVVEDDAFAGFVMEILKNKGAFGIPLGYTEEEQQEFQEDAESRCLSYLYADIVIRG